MADKSHKANQLKPRLPSGFVDRTAGEIIATRQMIARIREVYERYGFEPAETSAVEYADALGKFLPDQDRPNEGVFSFLDDDEQWLALRYDLTAPLARYVAQNFDALPKPYRSYREGWVFRNEKPGPGRFRQFMQFDADTVGSPSPAADAEMCMMAADTMEALGIPRGSYVIKVWNRKLLDGIMDAEPLLKNDSSERLRVLRAMDKRDRLGLKGVQDLAGVGRKDESGDFTQGARLTSIANNFIVSSVTTSTIAGSIFELFPASALEEVERKEPPPFEFDAYRKKLLPYIRARDHETFPPSFETGMAELKQISELITTAGFDDRVKIDPSVVRGLEYYTGAVYEIELTFSMTGEDGAPVRFGSVGGGGRYDGLIGRFRSEDVPATGVSIGVSRLAAALAHLRKIDVSMPTGPVVVTVMDGARLPDYQNMVAQLRAAGIRAELYLGSGKMGAQLKYADKRASPCVVIQGDDEKAKGEVQIKDLIEGAKAASAIATHAEWREARPAQFAVPEDKLVETVREVLRRHIL